MTTTETAPTKPAVSLDRAFQLLTEQLQKAQSGIQRRIMRHITATIGRPVPLPTLHHDESVEDQTKHDLYRVCVKALVDHRRGVANWDAALSGAATEEKEMPAQATTPKPASEESATEASQPQPRRSVKPVAAPAPQAEADDDGDAMTAALALLQKAAARPRGIDENRIVQLLDEREEKLMGALDEFMDAHGKKLISAADVHAIVDKAINNGSFPTDRVEKIAEDIAKRVTGAAMPSFDVDTMILPRIEALLQTKVTDLLKKGPAALVTKPKAVASVSAAFIPDINKDFLIEPDMKELFRHVLDKSKEKPVNLVFTGPKGCGKTELATQLAALSKRLCGIVDFANVRESRDLFGHKGADGGSTYWKKSQYAVWVESGQHVVIHDEIGRAQNSQIANTLFPLFDHRRFTFVEEAGEVLRVGPGTIMVATLNEGMAYTGSAQLDLALEDRLTIRVEVEYIKPDKEAAVLHERTGITAKDADSLAEIAENIRKKAIGFGATLTKTISTRQLLDAADLYRRMGSKSLRFSILNHFSAEGGETSERAQVALLCQGKFGSV